LELGTKNCKSSPTLFEDNIHDAILEATKQMLANLGDVRNVLTESLTLALATENDGFDRAATEHKIKEKQTVMLDLVKVTAASGQTAEYLDAKFAELSTEIKALQSEIVAHDNAQSAARNANARLSEILALLDADTLDLTEYDDRLTRQTVERVTALQDGSVRIVFKTGYETEIFL
jgi:outer membrane murein-binding lipoprotein Lpp